MRNLNIHTRIYKKKFKVSVSFCRKQQEFASVAVSGLQRTVRTFNIRIKPKTAKVTNEKKNVLIYPYAQPHAYTQTHIDMYTQVAMNAREINAQE